MKNTQLTPRKILAEIIPEIIQNGFHNNPINTSPSHLLSETDIIV